MNTALVEALGAYVQLLEAELDETVTWAAVHGWRSSRFEEGERLRAAIVAARGGE